MNITAYQIDLRNKYKLLFQCIIFSLILTLPDLYSILRNPSTWVPVNSTPYSVNDEYHYFSTLNSINSEFISLPHDNLRSAEILSVEVVRILAYMVNLPFYKLGCFLFDQRVGILFVRIFNAVLLYLSINYFYAMIANSAFKDSKIEVRILSYKIVGVLLIYPLFYGYQMNYILDSRFMFDNGSSFTDLTRSIYSSTSGPAFIFAVAWLLSIFSDRKKNSESSKPFYIPMAIFAVLSFIHMTMAYIFIFSTAILLLYTYGRMLLSKHLMKSLLFVALVVSIMFIQRAIMTSSEALTEAFDISLNPSLTFFQAFSSFTLPLLFYIVFRKKQSTVVFILYFCTALFHPFLYLGSTHLSRFWLRGALIPYAMLSIYFLFLLVEVYGSKIISLRFSGRACFAVTVLMWAVLGIFYYRNAVFMYYNYDRATTNPQLLRYVLSVQEDSGPLVITNSFDVCYFAPLYSRMKTYLINYSLQQDGYKEHFKRLMTNYALLGVKKADFVMLFDRYRNPIGTDWIGRRPIGVTAKEVRKTYYAYEILETGTYRYYNTGLIRDGMCNRQDHSMTSKFILFIDKNYPSEIYRNFGRATYDIVLDLTYADIMKTFGPEDYNYTSKLALDDGKIVILKNATLK